ncbi:MAG TPA: hypothetical protein VMU50_03830 [Polyangia bacterium]|nr:hypothetical protein [Polyangia bacterium]
MRTPISEVKISRQMQSLAMVGAFSLLALGCSSSNNNGTQGGSGGNMAGTGGAAGTGGTSGGTGGTSAGTGGTTAGTGGTTAGTGGATTTDGGGADAYVSCVTASAASPVISDFAGTTATANQVNGAAAEVWAVTPAGTATVAGGEMHASSTTGTFGTVAVLVAKGMCADVSKYTGIKFRIHSPSNTMLVFGVQTPETMMDYSNFNKVFAVSATAADVMLPFAEQKATFGVGAALPATYKVAEHVRAIDIGIVGATMATQSELLDIYVSNVTFY